MNSWDRVCPGRDQERSLVVETRDAATSSYHGDDDDHDDDDLDYDDGDERYDEGHDCSVVEAATVRIRPVQEYSSDDDYGPYWDNSPTSMPYLDHVSD